MTAGSKALHALLLVLLLCVPMDMLAQVSTSKPLGEGTQESPYLISTAAELAWFRDWVNGTYSPAIGETATVHPEACARLTQDIDLSPVCHAADEAHGVEELSWTPISNDVMQSKGWSYVWRGTFDGGGHTLSHLYINATSPFAGLFGIAYGGEEHLGGVKDIVFAHSRIEHTNYYTGVALGYAYKISSVTGITVEETVEVNGMYGVGGIVGIAEEVNDLSLCVNRGVIRAADVVGGISGVCVFTPTSRCANYGSVTNYSRSVVGYIAAAGGVLGVLEDATVADCANYAAVSGYEQAGGIVGRAKHAELRNVLNTGHVSVVQGYTTTTQDEAVPGGLLLGLAVGTVQMSGVQAYLDGATLTHPEGEVVARSIGALSSGNDTQVEGDTYGFAFSAATLRSGAVAYDLNNCTTDGTQAWYQDLSETGDAYPVLKPTGSNVVYRVYDYACNGVTVTKSYYKNDTVGYTDPHQYAIADEADAEGVYDIVCAVCTEAKENCKAVKHFNHYDDYLEVGGKQGDVYPVEDVDLDDAGIYGSPVSLRVQRLAYSRHFAHTAWQALYVPFDIPFNAISDDFDAAALNDMHQYDDDEDGTFDRTVMEVLRVKAGETLTANTPYLIKPKTAGHKVITLTDALMRPAASNSLDCSSVRISYTFTGTYYGISGADMYANGYYALAGGAMCTATDPDVALGAFRWYMQAVSRMEGGNLSQTSPRIVIVVKDGETGTTGIDSINTPSAPSAPVYDLHGRRIVTSGKQLPKGVYIVNRRKVIK